MSNEQNIPQLNQNDPDSLYNWVAYKITCPDFRKTIKDFINDNCSIFIDTEENNFEYEQIFKEFNQLIDFLINNILIEGNISKEEFQNMVKRGRGDKKYKKYFKHLTTLKDYSLFKTMMYKRNYELTKEAENEINEKKNFFILRASSTPIDISRNPYAVDSQIEEKTKERTPKPKEIRTTEKQKDIKKKDENNTPNSIINSLKEIVMNKVNINIRNIEDEAPIMEEVSDESLDKNL